MNDLPGTFDDEMEFNEILKNFGFEKNHTTKIVCQESNYGELS